MIQGLYNTNLLPALQLVRLGWKIYLVLLLLGSLVH